MHKIGSFYSFPPRELDAFTTWFDEHYPDGEDLCKFLGVDTWEFDYAQFRQAMMSAWYAGSKKGRIK